MVERVREGHFTKVVMMTIAFAVGGNVDKLRPVALIRKSVQESLGEGLSVVEEVLERHRAGDGTIVEKQSKLSTRWEANKVGASRIDPLSTDVFPGAHAYFSDAARLAWS